MDTKLRELERQALTDPDARQRLVEGWMNTRRSTSMTTETTTYYRVRFEFKHDTRFHKAGETWWLWNYHETYDYWELTDDPLGSRIGPHRFTTIKAARAAAKKPSREDYGGDKCCTRVVERVIEAVERVTGVKAPPPKKPAVKKKKARRSLRHCRDCKSVGAKN